jgi:MtfA peptidase
VLGRVELDSPLYAGLDAVVVYPSTYKTRVQRREGYVTIDHEQARLGESWTHGVVVLAWDAVVSGAVNRNDGHDVVLHEFAHQLDAQDGAMDGTPELDDLERYSVWSRVAGEEYAALVEAVEHHRKTSIDAYGATNAPEFFAVVVEQFFEQPTGLERRHPELYAELATFFRFDPAARLRERAARRTYFRCRRTASLCLESSWTGADRQQGLPNCSLNRRSFRSGFGPRCASQQAYG